MNINRLTRVSGYVVFGLMGLLLFVLILSFEVSLPLLLLLTAIVAALVATICVVWKRFRVGRVCGYVVLVFFTALLIKRMALESFRIPSQSMDATLAIGDRVLVTKLLPKAQRGGVVVFKNTWLNNNENMVKRCLALPGDAVTIDSGTLFVNAENADQHPGISKIYQVGFSSKQHLLACAKLYPPLSVSWPGKEVYVKLTNNQVDTFMKQFNGTLVSMRIATAETIGKLDSMLTGTADQPTFRLPRVGDSVRLFRSNVVEWVKRISGAERDSLRMIRDKMKRGELEQCTYRFKENYYFVAGDNRCHSADSRHTGLIPESAIIGSAMFIFFSLDADKQFPFNFRAHRFLQAFE